MYYNMGLCDVTKLEKKDYRLVIFMNLFAKLDDGYSHRNILEASESILYLLGYPVLKSCDKPCELCPLNCICFSFLLLGGGGEILGVLPT